jgi:hypothetical protein
METATSTTLHLQGKNVGGNDFISVKHEQFDALLHDYDPYMSCIFVPAEHRERELTEFCYAIVHAEPQKPPYIVRWLTPEMLDQPEKILGDARRQGRYNILAKIDAEEKFKKLARMRAEAEIQAEERDLLENIVKGGRNRLHTYRHNGVKYA